MNEEALDYAYNLFTADGYDGSVEEFNDLISTNKEALDYSFELFSNDGYDGSIEDFAVLIGVDKIPKKQTESQIKIDARIKNVNKVYSEQVDKINSGQWDDDQKIELTKRVAAARDKQLEKLEKEKGVDAYASELARISRTVPENIDELTSELEFDDYENYFNALQAENTENRSEEELDAEARRLYALSKYRTELTDQALEDFETEYGIDKTDNIVEMLMGNIAGVGLTMDIWKGAINLYDDYTKGGLDNVSEEWKADKWKLVTDLNTRYFGTEDEKEYKKNREELHKLAIIKNEELDTEYRDRVAELTVLKNKADKDYIEFEKLEKRLKQKDSTITSDDYNRYLFLHNQIKNDQTEFDKKLEYLNNNLIPSNDFETIKNLTLKTYDNLERLDNIVGASVIDFGGAMATLDNELSLGELIKWTGIDIKSEEGLDRIFGENTEGVMGVVKDAVGKYGDYTKKKREIVSEAYDLSNYVRGLNAPSIEWKDVNISENPEDFAYWAGDMFAGQVLNTALILAFPPVGLALLAAQAAGGKMNEMNVAMEGVKDENGEFIIEPEEYNALQYFGSAALYGGIEYATERVSFGLLKGMLGNVSKAFKLTGRSALPSANITLKNLSNGQAWANFGVELVKGAAKEGAAEGIVTITNNLTDQYVLGDKDAYWLNNVDESFVSGFLMGKAYGAPNIAVPILHSFSSEGELAKANKRNKELRKLSIERDKVLKNGGDATQIQNRITELLDEQMLAMEGVRLRGIKMSPEDRQFIINSSNEQHGLREIIDTINNNKDIDQESKEMLINGYAQKIQEIESERSRVFSEYGKQARAKQALEMVESAVEDADLDAKIIEVESAEELQKVYKDKLGEDISKEEANKKSKDNFGLFLGKKGKDGKRILILNKAEIAKYDAWTTAQHEILHEVLNNMFKGDMGDNAYVLANSLKEKLAELDVDAIENSDLATRIANYNLDPTVTDQVAAEEVLTLFSEALATKDIKFDEGFFTKIKDILRRVFQSIGLGGPKFNTAEDVYNFIKDYNKSIEKGKFTKAQKTAMEEGVTVSETLKEQSKKPSAKVQKVEQVIKKQEALLKEFYADQGLTTEASKDKASKNIANETQQEKSKRQDKRNVDVGKIYNERAKGKNKQQWNEFLDSARGERVMGDLIQQYYPDMVATAIKQNAESPMDVASEAIIPLMQHIRAFDPSINDDLAGYVGGYLGLKVGTAGKKVAKKTATISMEQEGVKQVAEKQAVEQTSSKEAPGRKGIILADRLRGKAKEAVEKIESKVNTKALTEAKEIGPITKEEQIEYLEKQTYKSLKDLVSDETQEMFGITPKPGNLTKQDIKNAQMFIASNVDALISMLPEGSTPSGTATGVQKVLLDAFYTKRSEKVKLAKTGSKAGLKPFVKNSNIDPAKFLEIFGITKKGEQNLYKKESNTSSRIKALVEQTGRLITNQTVRQAVPEATKVGEGKSKVMFSKIPKFLKTDFKVETGEGYAKFVKRFAKEFDITIPKEIRKKDGVVVDKQGQESLKQFASEVLPKYFPTNKILSSGTWGNTKLGKGMWFSSDSLSNIKDVFNKNKSKELSSESIKNLDQALASAGLSPMKTSSNVFVNEKFINKINANYKGLETFIDQSYKLLKENPEQVSNFLAMLKGASTSSSHFWRNFSQLMGKETNWNVDKKGGRGEHALVSNEAAEFMVKSLLYALSNPSKASNILNTTKKLLTDNYFQFLISVTNDTKLTEAGLQESMTEGFWESWKEALESGDTSKAWSVLSRYFNEKVNNIKGPDGTLGLNPNAIMLYDRKSGKQLSLADILDIGEKEFGKEIIKNPNFIQAQQKVIEQFSIRNPEYQKASYRKKVLKDEINLSKNKDKASKKNIIKLNKSKVIKTSDKAPNSEDVRQAEILDKALNIARDPNAPTKKIRVFDFDDTLARTKSNVLYTMPDGKTGKLTAEEFAKRGTEMLEQGAEFDFSEFNKVMKGKKGPLFNVAKKIQEARGTKDVFVLTARAAAAAPAIKEFLDSVGLNIPIENITGLGDSSPLAKSGWIVDKAADGYNDFYFADDHLGNVDAVKRVLDVIDVKSKVQQAKVKFSKNVDKMMNNIIFEKTGIEEYKEFSQIAAQAKGRKKKSFDLIPPSAQDFGGLLYKLLAKGETGNIQWQWMQEHLIKPYGRAMNDLSVAQNQLMADFRALKKGLVGIPKNLKKEAIKGFTNEDVVRVATWDRQGIEVEGISKRDLDAIRKYVEGKPDLNIFIDQLIAITKGDGYYYPGKNWLAGTITTDFREGLRQVTRKNLLQQWQENVDLAFNESNMNKLEAAFGPKYREALENSLQRMSTGQNKRQGMSRVEQRFLDYINNSVGAVMFLNARSAVLQTISAANFINWKDNNPMKAALAFANQKQYWSDFITLMNSDFLVDRRNGLKINVSESEIAEAAKTSKNTVKGVISLLLNKGFVFTQIADSFAIATGGATLYRNRIKTYMKEGMSEAEAIEKAFLDFRELAEESQQSARADKISQQQASTLGRLVLAFANTPSQYARIMDKAGRDLINGRGDWKANMSKIAYYGFVQNLMFTALQTALFALAAGDDDDEEAKIPEEKVISTANSMADNILKGIGVHGVVISAAKNTIMDLIERSQKDPYFNPDAPSFPGPDYTESISKLIAISPPLSIKLRKIKGGITDWYFNRWRPEAGEMFNINNPSYRAASKVIAGVTNVPLDRLFQKMENIQGAMDDVNPTWQRIFMALGWPKWQLETEKEKEKRKATEKKERRNIRAKEDPAVYTKAEQVSILKQYKLSDAEIKKLKNEDLRVKKIIELRNKTKRIYTPR